MDTNQKALVTYVTKYGTTAEYAKKIADSLRASGLQVDLLEVSAVSGLDDYGSVILGSPIYFNRVLGRAEKFVQKHRHELETKNVGMFAVGMTHNERAGREFTGQALDILASNAPGLKPKFGMFLGEVRLSRMNLLYRWFIRIFTDIENADQIRFSEAEEWTKEFLIETGQIER